MMLDFGLPLGAPRDDSVATDSGLDLRCIGRARRRSGGDPPVRRGTFVDISRRGGTPGAHHVAVDLADPDSWPVVAVDFRQRLDGYSPDMVVFVHNAGTLAPLGPADRVDTAQYTRNVLLNSAAGPGARPGVPQRGLRP